MSMQLHRVTPEGDLAAGLTRLGEAIVAADSPWARPWTEAGLRATLRAGWDGEAPRWWAGVVDGQVVGSAASWVSHYDNLDAAWFAVGVHPEHRRAGLGSRLLAHLEQDALSDGRPNVGMDGWDLPATHAFAIHHGYSAKSVSILRRQVVADLPSGWRERADLAQRDHASDYELLKVEGAVPDDLVRPMSVLWADINDAPRDDLVFEDEVFTVDRIRGYEQAQLQTNRLYHLIGRHRHTGDFGGHTVVAVEVERPTRASQHDTTVARAHRGHRLGLVLKSRMMEWLADAEPQLAEVDTYNAESNAHMIAVNEALGYRVVGREVAFQRLFTG